MLGTWKCLLAQSPSQTFTCNKGTAQAPVLAIFTCNGVLQAAANSLLLTGVRGIP